MRNVIFEQDGNQICAHYENFSNLQESNAGFGDDEAKAKANLYALEAPGCCQRAMWTGYGAPTWCYAPAYGPSDELLFVKARGYDSVETYNWFDRVNPNAQMMQYRHLEQACPRHGGPTPPQAQDANREGEGR